ncbi:DNA sulfur modification protein DndD, partial [Halieaceae bacterium]|nr:DNA sulfur modification protein DndD [Halieaceae bacterium]
QLALYGKFAKCSNRGDSSYKDYLSETINRYAKPEEGAALELEFIHQSEGKSTTYRIKRFWHRAGKSISEDMEVIKDGILDAAMSGQWYEYVDEFIPANISGLFFFDGEKIENLANPDSAGEIIQTGIKSLLGLDIVDKLSGDLKTIARRRAAKSINSKTEKKVSLLEEEIDKLQIVNKELSEKVASKNSAIDSLNAQISDAKKDYQKHGGSLYEQRELMASEHRNNLQSLKHTEGNIIKYAEGPAPLILVKDLIEKAKKQSLKETTALNNRNVIPILEERDLELLGKFSEQSTSDGDLDILNRLLKDDREKRERSAKKSTPLSISSTLFDSFDNIFFRGLQKERMKLLKELDEKKEKLATSDKQLSAIPDADMIKEVAAALNNAERKLAIATGEFNTLNEVFTDSEKSLNSKKTELDRVLHSANDQQLSAHQDKRIIVHAAEVQETLTLYREALIAKHITRLQDLIRESFISLIRKKDLVKDIHINTDDFSLEVISKSNEVVPSSRLSAGERQLLAISILWGLAKASGRPLPSIIDTPLGRLDSEHRGHLVKNYFPNASHQVILLSTDTEIDAHYRDALAKSIGKEYHIQYKEEEQTSTITQGYF